MNSLIRNWTGVALFAAAAAALPGVAAAATIDFEGLTPAIYFAGESFTQAGFRMTVDFDFGTVDTAAGLGTAAPTGNPTQFYFNSNDGGLIISRDDALPFSLDGFSAAFVPQANPPAAQIVIVALGATYTSTNPLAAWLFAPAGAGGTYPFATYSNAPDFAAFTNLRSVEFFACSLSGNTICSIATNDSAQFAIDNIMLTPVPEPATIAMMLAGIAGLGAATRRKIR